MSKCVPPFDIGARLCHYKVLDREKYNEVAQIAKKKNSHKFAILCFVVTFPMTFPTQREEADGQSVSFLLAEVLSFIF